MKNNKPNLLVILVDDLRFDETGASGHPYMKSPHIDRLAHEGAMFANAFHTTPAMATEADAPPTESSRPRSVWAYSSSARLPSSSTTSPRNHSISSLTSSRAGRS